MELKIISLTSTSTVIFVIDELSLPLFPGNELPARGRKARVAWSYCQRSISATNFSSQLRLDVFNFLPEGWTFFSDEYSTLEELLILKRCNFALEYIPLRNNSHKTNKIFQAFKPTVSIRGFSKFQFCPIIERFQLSKTENYENDARALFPRAYDFSGY